MNIKYFTTPIPLDLDHRNRHIVCDTGETTIEFVAFPFQPYYGHYKDKSGMISNTHGAYYVSAFKNLDSGKSECYARDNFADIDSAVSWLVNKMM